jgi:triacylglycerol esterase/lipase EstA (alpha/beta hydrolase family)
VFRKTGEEGPFSMVLNWFKRRPAKTPQKQEPSTLRGRKKLVLFIHGLGGDADSTWKQFPELLKSDAELAKLYDVESVGYDTGLFGSQPSLGVCASILKTEIDIALIAHSQGGLIARSYFAERLNSGQKLRVSRLLTFATPHHGSGHATS